MEAKVVLFCYLDLATAKYGWLLQMQIENNCHTQQPPSKKVG
jgi:hypothetical protein